MPQTTRDRLADISHHFLSEPEIAEVTTTAGNDQPETVTVAHVQPRKTLTFAVLAHDSGYTELPMFQLCKQLTSSGWSTAIIDQQDEPRAISFISRNYMKHCITVHQGACVDALEELTRDNENTIHDAHFRIVDASMTEELVSAHRVLLPINLAEAGSEPVQQLIKQLYESNENARIKIIFTDSPDARLAAKGFNRLSSHSQFIFDQEPDYLGHLPIISGSADDGSACQQLKSLAERLSHTIADRGRVLFREASAVS